LGGGLFGGGVLLAQYCPCDSNAVRLGVKKPYYVRDYLSPKHIREHGLAEILEAMEVADHNNGKCKKQLLSYLWPHTDQNFSVTFQAFKRKKPGLLNEDENQGDCEFSNNFIQLDQEI